MTRHCSVPACKVGCKSLKSCSVFKVPKDDVLRKKWESLIPGIMHLKSNQYVCEKHFDKKDIITKLVMRDSEGNIVVEAPYQRIRLAKSALPTIFGEQIVTLEKSTIFDNETFTNVCTESNKITSAHATSELGDMLSSEEMSPILPQIPTTAEDDWKNDDMEPEILSEEIKPHLSSEQISLSSEEIILDELSHRMDVEFTQPKIYVNEIKLKKTSIFNSKTITRMSVDKEEDGLNSMDGNRQTTFISKTLVDNETPCAAAVSSVLSKEFTITIPKSWCFCESYEGNKRYLIFSLVQLIGNNDPCGTVIEKCLVIQEDGTISYRVYGKVIDLQERTILKNIDDIALLPKILLKFERMRVCQGAGLVDESLIEGNTAFRNNRNDWHHLDCTLITKRKRCKFCLRLRKTLSQKKARLVKWKEEMRVKRDNRVPNPIDEKKVIELRSRLNCHDYIKARLDEIFKNNELHAENILEADQDYANSLVPDRIMYHVAGHLCKQVLRDYSACVTCRAAIVQDPNNHNTLLQLLNLKSKGELIHPNTTFFKFIRFVESCFTKHAGTKKVFDRTVEEVLSSYHFTFPCQTHASDILSFALQHYVRMRIRQFKMQANQKKQKT